MSISEAFLPLRARVKVSHERPYDFDEKTGLYALRKVDDDEDVWNLTTNAGRVQLHTFMYGTTSRTNGFRYLGISNDGTSPAAGDTSLTAELSGNGLTRAAATVTLPTGAGTQTTVSNAFTYAGVSAQLVQKSALFDAASVGVMAHEVLFTQRSLSTGDILTVTYTITVS